VLCATVKPAPGLISELRSEEALTQNPEDRVCRYSVSGLLFECSNMAGVALCAHSFAVWWSELSWVMLAQWVTLWANDNMPLTSQI